MFKLEMTNFNKAGVKTSSYEQVFHFKDLAKHKKDLLLSIFVNYQIIDLKTDKVLDSNYKV